MFKSLLKVIRKSTKPYKLVRLPVPTPISQYVDDMEQYLIDNNIQLGWCDRDHVIFKSKFGEYADNILKALSYEHEWRKVEYKKTSLSSTDTQILDEDIRVKHEIEYCDFFLVSAIKVTIKGVDINITPRDQRAVIIENRVKLLSKTSMLL